MVVTLSYMKGKVALGHVGLRSRNFGGRRSFFTSLMKVKVVLDHDGFRSGNFGRKGTFFSSQTKGNVVLDHSGLKSGDLGRTETSLKSQTRARLFLITLDPDILAGWVVVANQGNQEIVKTLLYYALLMQQRGIQALFYIGYCH